MSGEDSVEAWESGSFDEDPDRPEVMAVAVLLPFGQQNDKRSSWWVPSRSGRTLSRSPLS